MWLDFSIAFLFLLLIVYIPSSMGLMFCGVSPRVAISAAPLLTIFFLVIEAEIYSLLGIKATWLSMMSPLFALVAILGLACFIGSKHFGRISGRNDSDSLAWKGAIPALLYLCLGVIVVTFVFVKNLDGTSSVLEEYDNIAHLGRVKVFLESQDYSSFGRNLDCIGAVSNDSAPFDYSASSLAFYPSAWHILAALAVDTVGVSIPAAANVLNSFISGVVWPLSIFGMLSTLFPRNRRLILSGSLVSMVFGAFPWGFLVFGPLYPNLLSYSIAPAVISSFIQLFSREKRLVSRFRYLVIFVIGVFSLVFAQTNAVFLLAVMLAPFCVSLMSGLSRLKVFSNNESVWRKLFCGIAIVAIAIVWYSMYRAPFLSSVVSFNWAAVSSPVQAFVSFLTLGLTSMTSAQPLLAILVLWGFVRLLSDHDHRWLVGSYLFAGMIYMVAISTEGELKHILAGFWYTDRYRLAATVAFCAIPLAAYGLFDLGLRVEKFIEKNVQPDLKHNQKQVFLSRICGSVVILILILFPNYEIPGYATVTTAFGRIRGLISTQNNMDGVRVLDSDERAFVEEVLKIVPEGELIINQPNDGSAFLFSEYDINLYYRYLSGYGGTDELEDSKLIREQLNEIASNDKVKCAVDDIGARYVLLLDLGGEWTDDRRWLDSSYFDGFWTGLNSIDDNTPGFKVVLAEGDMRLYEIVQ